MDKWREWPKIRYESQLDRDFADQIASIPGGEKLFTCIQCGTCSGMCPLSPDMDYTPRQIIAMIRAGFRQEVLSSHTTWLCASCYACTVECPKEIKITEIMYAAKRLAIREKVHPKRFPPSVLAREFFGSVEKNGRSTESRVLINLFLKTNLLGMFRQAGLGMKLWLKGRLGPGKESIKRTDELHRMLAALEKEHMIKPKKSAAMHGEVK